MPSTGHPAGDLLIYAAAILASVAAIYRFVWPIPRRVVLGLWRMLQGTVRLVETIKAGAEDYHQTGGFGGLREHQAALAADVSALRDQASALTADVSGLAVQVGQVQKEMHPNGGSSMRDDIQTGVREARAANSEARRAVAEAERVGHITEELRGFAEDNRAGIARLDAGQHDVAARITAVEGHYDADARTTRELQQYLDNERQQLVFRAATLEASLNEVLSIREPPIPHTRATDPETPDHEPDL